MDGMLFIVYFFPLLVFFSFGLSILCFFMTLWAGFYEDFEEAMTYLIFKNGNAFFQSLFQVDLYEPKRSNAVDKLFDLLIYVSGHPPFTQYPHFYPTFVTITTLSTVTLIYYYGGILQHAKRGWHFYQIGRGGIRFVILQSMTWITLVASCTIPWTAVDNIGLLSRHGFADPASKDSRSHAGLVVAGAALGVLSNTTNILGLMSFDNSKKTTNMKLRKLDTGKWRWSILGDGMAWWWMFMALQWTMVVFSLLLAYVSEAQLRSNVVQIIVLVVFTLVLAYSISITNAIGGKWRYGERVFRMYMPLEGGIIFSSLQAVGWFSFSLALLITVYKLLVLCYGESLSYGPLSKFSIKFAGGLGVVSYLFILSSLLYFDSAAISPSVTLSDDDDDDDDEALLEKLPVVDDDDYDDNTEDDATIEALNKSHRRRSKKVEKNGRNTLRSRSREPRRRAGDQVSSSTRKLTSRSNKLPNPVSKIMSRKLSPDSLVQILGRRSSPSDPKEVEYLVQIVEKNQTPMSEWIAREWLKEQPVYMEALAAHESRQARLASNGRSGIIQSPRPSQASPNPGTFSPSLRIPSTNSAMDDWDECEDEEGNVFYINVRTGASSLTLPHYR